MKPRPLQNPPFVIAVNRSPEQGEGEVRQSHNEGNVKEIATSLRSSQRQINMFRKCFRAVFFATVALNFCLLPTLHAAESFSGLDVNNATTPAELSIMVEQLNAGSSAAVNSNAFNQEMQSAVLEKSKDIIDKLVSLHGKSPQDSAEQERSVFLINREVIKRILDLNRKVLADYQEKLDDMANPQAFFKTPAWRQPEQLAATASFRLGWNNYYAGLLFAESDPAGSDLFREAVENFSRALVDAQDDKIIITSVFGRGLCYKRLKAYSDALKDFQSVREAIKKDDLMKIRCRYEEAHISYLTEKFQDAIRILDKIDKEYPADKMPDALKTSFHDLRESALRAIAERAAGKSDVLPALPKESP